MTTGSITENRWRIAPAKGWQTVNLREVWRYRDLLWFHIVRDVKGRYRQMALGPLWIVLQPIANMIVFTIIFGRVAGLPSEGAPYALFTLCALIPWTFFSNATEQSVDSLVRQMAVISKVYFPRLIIPMSAVCAGLVDFMISFSMLIVILLISGYYSMSALLFVPLYVLLAGASCLAISLWTASLTVRFRDFRLLVKHGIQIAMYATPVAYSATLVSGRWLWLYKLNPMFYVVDGFRWTLLGTGLGPEPYMVFPIGIVCILLVTGLYVFCRTEKTIVDLL